jgi:hypothetical protein
MPANVRDFEYECAAGVGRRRVVLLQRLDERRLALLLRALQGSERRAVVAGVIELRVNLPTFTFKGDREAWTERQM